MSFANGMINHTKYKDKPLNKEVFSVNLILEEIN
jgi:hypothetical protein